MGTASIADFPINAGRGRSDATSHDFRRPPRISAERRAVLDAMHGRFAASVERIFTSALRQPAKAQLASADVVTFGEFVDTVAFPCAAFHYELGERATPGAVLLFTPSLASHALDRMLGGIGDAAEMRRSLTTLERRVATHLAHQIMTAVCGSWREWLEMTPALRSPINTIEQMTLCERNDAILSATIDIHSGDTLATLLLAIPMLVLEPCFPARATGGSTQPKLRADERAAARAAVESQLRAASMPVSVRLPVFGLAAIDVASLQPGQVIPTGIAVGAPVEVHVNRRRLFHGALGRAQGSVGVRVTEPAPIDPTQPPRFPRRTVR